MSSMQKLCFLNTLRQASASGRIPVIPDIKCVSPKDGDLMRGRDPRAIACNLAAGGAPVLSVVTEGAHFGGSMDLLKDICRAVNVPVLRKDFIEEEADLDRTKEAGADAVLLMVSCLGEERLTGLYHAALSRGLTPFVETHTPESLRFALHRLKAPLIGINHRDILVLEKDDGNVSLTQQLLDGTVPLPDAREGGASPLIVAESAMHTPSEVRSAIRAGADAALVGTGILTAPDPVRMYQRMTRRAGLKICGLMSEADVDACLENHVDLCGFVTEYPVPVRWNLTEAQAAPLIRRAHNAGTRTCIVTGGSFSHVLSLAKKLKPDYVQLHFRETLEETVRICQALHAEGISLIRSVPMNPAERLAMFGTDSLPDSLRMLDSSPADAILIDSRDAENAASGGGRILSEGNMTQKLRDTLRNLRSPLFCGGGITAENAAGIMALLHPDCLDVMTGAEDPHGRKDARKIRSILASY